MKKHYVVIDGEKSTSYEDVNRALAYARVLCREGRPIKVHRIRTEVVAHFIPVLKKLT